MNTILVKRGKNVCLQARKPACLQPVKVRKRNELYTILTRFNHTVNHRNRGFRSGIPVQFHTFVHYLPGVRSRAIVHPDYCMLMNHQPPSEPLISLRKVSIYRDQNLVLKDVEIDVHRGDFLFIIGRVGEGKSSLIKTLIAELPVTRGKASVCGFDLCHIRPSQIPFLRRKIGIVFQDFRLLSDRTVGENLEFVLRATGWSANKQIEKQIQEVLQRVGLLTKAFKMPHQLSGGEQQRLCIARSLLNDPSLILADEPTGNLDPDSSFEVMDLLSQLQQEGKAVVVATHNYSLLTRYPYPTYRCANCELSLTRSPGQETDFEALIRDFSTEFSHGDDGTDARKAGWKEGWKDYSGS